MADVPDFTGPPDPTGLAKWFPTNKLDLNGWRFDVITLLAVIGESSVAIHAQTLTASKLCLLPRIIPAPQALLRPIRPQRLPEVTAKMAGVYGGTVLDTVGFFANIMHPLEDLKPFAFRVLKITHKDKKAEITLPNPEPPAEATTTGVGVRGWLGTRRRVGVSGADGLSQIPEDKRVTFPGDLEMQPISTGDTAGTEATTSQPRKPSLPKLSTLPRSMSGRMSGRVASFMKQERYAVPPKLTSPLHLVSILSFLVTIAIFIVTAVWNDGVAMVAIFAMGLASSITCYASWWRPLLMGRPAKNKVPEGDVMIRTREGAFLLIQCQEEVARELYTAREECQYVSTKYHRVYMGIGMVLLMVAVVLLGNCGWNSQVLIGAAYVVLNGVYWVMGLIPPKYFWDLDRYEMEDVTPDDAKNAHLKTCDDEHEGMPSFTRTLWFAIRETRHGAWVERSGAMPGTDQWKKWLAEATRNAWDKNRKWPAVTRKSEIMREDMYTGLTPTSMSAPGMGGLSPVETRADPAAQVAPLEEVKPKLPHEQS